MRNLKAALNLILVVIAYIFISQAYGASCSFKTQINYQDGTVGCIEDLAIANKVPKGSSKKIIDTIKVA
jgi:hypothetical protein